MASGNGEFRQQWVSVGFVSNRQRLVSSLVALPGGGLFRWAAVDQISSRQQCWSTLAAGSGEFRHRQAVVDFVGSSG